MTEIKGEICPACGKKTLTLIEETMDIPHFGKCYLMSMTCTECRFHNADVESEEAKSPAKYTFEVKTEKDLNTRVVKSASASLRIPELRMSVTPGENSTGYISNIEGVLKRFKEIIEVQKDAAEEESERKSAKNLLKKIWKVESGEMPITLIIEDPRGNSAIISDRAKVEPLKKK